MHSGIVFYPKDACESIQEFDQNYASLKGFYLLEWRLHFECPQCFYKLSRELTRFWNKTII